MSRLKALGRAVHLLSGGSLQTGGAIVLAYHDVGDDPANTTDYYVHPERFRQQLVDAVRWGLRFVDLGELVSRVLDDSRLDGMAAIVFDDSLAGVHHHAMPILLELGLPATIFTVTDYLGHTPPWWDGAARVMTRGEIEELVSNGFRVASHTRTHASLPSLPARDLLDELSGSRKALEDISRLPIDLFAYPYGHHDRQVREAVAACGYRAAFSFLNGRVVGGLDPYSIPRLNMSERQYPLRLAYHLARPAGSWPDTQVEAVLGAT